MARRSQAELSQLLAPVLRAVEKQSGLAGRFVDKNVYCIYLATLWANLVVDPAAAGIDEADLEGAHDVINLAAAPILGEDAAITAAFRFLDSSAGEQAMNQAKLTRRHRQLLLYFCSMILDPEGHRRRRDEVRETARKP